MGLHFSSIRPRLSVPKTLALCTDCRSTAWTQPVVRHLTDVLHLFSSKRLPVSILADAFKTACAMSLDIDTITDQEIADFCLDPHRVLISNHTLSPFTSTVVKVSETIVVKLGADETEAKNQRISRTLVNPSIVRVPEVFRWFLLNGRNHLVMEFIEGRTFSEMTPSDAVSQLVAVIEHFANIRGTECGTLDRDYEDGFPRGLIWDNNHFNLNPSNTEEVEEFFNIRLKRSSKKVELTRRELVLCHLDLADRNILFLDSGIIALLDWCNVGFYPQALEFTALRMNHRPPNDLVKHMVRELQTNRLYQEAEVDLIEQGWALGVHWYL